jgi:chromosome segregation ATPase
VIAFAERLARLKRQFLELLDKDKEFRLAVAGYLGLSETLTRLESVEKNIESLLKEMKGLREGQNKLWEEVRALREGQNKLWENVNRLWESVNKLWENQQKLWEGQNRLWEEVRAMRGEVRDVNARLGRVERTLEKLTLEVEEEARIVIKHRLRELGYEVELTSLTLPEVEVNIYGASDDLCIIGEARVRASSSVLDEIDGKIRELRRLHPDRLRPRVLRVVYTTLAMPDLIARAEREGVWVLRAVGDVVRPRL